MGNNFIHFAISLLIVTTSPHPYWRASSTNAENNSPTLDEVYNWLDHNYHSKYAVRLTGTIRDFLLKLRPYLESLEMHIRTNAETKGKMFDVQRQGNSNTY